MDTLTAIDASLTATAICVYFRNGSHAMHCHTSESAGTGLARIARYQDLCSRILIDAEGPVFLESYSFSSPNRSVHIAEFGGILRAQLVESHSLIEVPPTTLKLFTIGVGKGDKTAMALAVFKRWKVEFTTDDEVDAFALAKFGAAILGWEPCANEAQKRAVASILNPPVKKPKRKAKL